MNSVMASFNTTVIQITEMSQWPKCHSEKNDRNVSAKKIRSISNRLHTIPCSQPCSCVRWAKAERLRVQQTVT